MTLSDPTPARETAPVVLYLGPLPDEDAPYADLASPWLRPMQGRAGLEHLLDRLRAQGFGDIILLASDSEQWKTALSRDEPGMRVRAHSAPNSIQALRDISLEGKDFLFIDQPIHIEFDYTQVLRERRQRNAIAAVTVASKDMTLEYDLVRLDREGAITGYKHQPSLSNWVSLGATAFSTEVFQWIPKEDIFGMEELIEMLIGGNRLVHAVPFEGTWTDLRDPHNQR